MRLKGEKFFHFYLSEKMTKKYLNFNLGTYFGFYHSHKYMVDIYGQISIGVVNQIVWAKRISTFCSCLLSNLLNFRLNFVFKNSSQLVWVSFSWDKSKQTSCNLPLVAVHHFCLTKGFQKTPDYSAIYRLERHLTVFYIAQIVPSFVVLYLS